MLRRKGLKNIAPICLKTPANDSKQCYTVWVTRFSEAQQTCGDPAQPKLAFDAQARQVQDSQKEDGP